MKYRGEVCPENTHKKSMRKKVAAVFISTITLATLAGCHKDDNGGNGTGVNDADRQFAMNASMSNYAEISAGQLASTKGSAQAVREFGRMMVADHTGAGDTLKSIASRLQLQTFDSLDDRHKRLADTLASLSGRAFDSVYINSQVLDHQTAISIFQDEANNGQHADLKRFASSVLPELQMLTLKSERWLS